MHWATCLDTPDRFFRFQGQTGCRQRYVGRAEDDPKRSPADPLSNNAVVLLHKFNLTTVFSAALTASSVAR